MARQERSTTSGTTRAEHDKRSIPLLDDAAIKAVRCWKYAPTIIGGKPVPILMTVMVKFALT